MTRKTALKPRVWTNTGPEDSLDWSDLDERPGAMIDARMLYPERVVDRTMEPYYTLITSILAQAVEQTIEYYKDAGIDGAVRFVNVQRKNTVLCWWADLIDMDIDRLL